MHVAVVLALLLDQGASIYVNQEIILGNNLPKVSIIIPAYNEENKISDSIESLKSIDYPKDLYEVIIVNESDELLGIGRLKIPIPYVKSFKNGIAINVRKGIYKKED